MRLIDADALKKEVDNFPNCYNGWSDTYDKAYIIEAIEEAPTIDAIPIEQYRSMVNTCYKLQKALEDMVERKEGE